MELDPYLDQFILIAYFGRVPHWKGIYLYFYLVKIQTFDHKIVNIIWWSLKHHQALCIIPSSYLNSNGGYSPETDELGESKSKKNYLFTLTLGHDLCDLDL